MFHEHLANLILDDLVRVLDPHWMRVVGTFKVRGGIGITVEAEHTRTEAARQQWRRGSSSSGSKLGQGDAQ